jgi:hypothetical protein
LRKVRTFENNIKTCNFRLFLLRFEKAHSLFSKTEIKIIKILNAKFRFRTIVYARIYRLFLLLHLTAKTTQQQIIINRQIIRNGIHQYFQTVISSSSIKGPGSSVGDSVAGVKIDTRTRPPSFIST